MNWISFTFVLLSAYAAYYLALIFWDHLSYKHAAVKIGAGVVKDHQNLKSKTYIKNEKTAKGIPMNDSVINSLRAYDNSSHKALVHTRFDKQTVDLMHKFKLATGVDIGKFVVFAVKYFFDTHPEIKTFVKQYLQNTEL